jgi:hypothetical protein
VDLAPVACAIPLAAPLKPMDNTPMAANAHTMMNVPPTYVLTMNALLTAPRCKVVDPTLMDAPVHKIASARLLIASMVIANLVATQALELLTITMITVFVQQIMNVSLETVRTMHAHQIAWLRERPMDTMKMAVSAPRMMNAILNIATQLHILASPLAMPLLLLGLTPMDASAQVTVNANLVFVLSTLAPHLVQLTPHQVSMTMAANANKITSAPPLIVSVANADPSALVLRLRDNSKEVASAPSAQSV